jgi:serine/threonine protein phosphatase PrpC
MKNATFDLETFNFNVNDVLVLISDGLPECVNHDDEMLDYMAVKECI